MLNGGGPADVRELTVALAAEMLDAAGVKVTDDEVAAALDDGRALKVWREVVAAQGGDPDAELPVASHTEVFAAPRSGVVAGLDALALGVASRRLGAGRARREDPVQAGAGIEIHARPGERVEAGDPILTLHTDTPERVPRALEAIEPGVTIADEAPELRPLILGRVG